MKPSINTHAAVEMDSEYANEAHLALWEGDVLIVAIDRNGVVHDQFPLESDEIVYWYDDKQVETQWLSGDQVAHDLDELLEDLRDSVSESVFVANDAYRRLTSALPIFIEENGYRPSGTLSSTAFQRICHIANCDVLNRYLYIQDVWWMADSLNSTHAIATDALAGYFRELANVECVFDYDGLFEISGVTARPVLKELQGFVLSLYSCLDIVTKLLHAIRNTPTSFSTVPSRIGGNTLFGKKQNNELAASSSEPLFEKHWETTYLGDLRNEILHNRALDASGVVFVYRNNGCVAERFVLLPDASENGVICSWKNRRRFYSHEFKANHVALRLYTQISEWLNQAIRDAVESISSSDAVELSLDDAQDVVERLQDAYSRVVG